MKFLSRASFFDRGGTNPEGWQRSEFEEDEVKDQAHNNQDDEGRDNVFERKRGGFC